MLPKNQRQQVVERTVAHLGTSHTSVRTLPKKLLREEDGER
jgi:hypothetical protein